MHGQNIFQELGINFKLAMSDDMADIVEFDHQVKQAASKLRAYLSKNSGNVAEKERNYRRNLLQTPITSTVVGLVDALKDEVDNLSDAELAHLQKQLNEVQERINIRITLGAQNVIAAEFDEFVVADKVTAVKLYAELRKAYATFRDFFGWNPEAFKLLEAMPGNYTNNKEKIPDYRYIYEGVSYVDYYRVATVAGCRDQVTDRMSLHELITNKVVPIEVRVIGMEG